jgi:isoleucyl-tRNA synthetase
MVVRVPNKTDEESLRRQEAQMLEELNVKRVVVTQQVGDLITYVIKPNFAVMGPKYGKKIGAIRDALGAVDPAAAAAKLEAGSPVVVTLPGEDGPLELQPEELVVETREREGFAVAQEVGLVVALDTELDDALLQEGIARDLVRIINDMRKSADFDVSDRISTYYSLEGPDDNDKRRVEGALVTHKGYLEVETLTTALSEGKPPAGAFEHDETIGSTVVHIAVARR